MVEQLTLNQPVTGSSPVSPSIQTPENKELAESKTDTANRQSQNLAPSLFLDSELDADLRVIVERWPELSVELRQAIVKMVE